MDVTEQVLSNIQTRIDREAQYASIATNAGVAAQAAQTGVKTQGLPPISFGSKVGVRNAEIALSSLLQNNPDLFNYDKDYEESTKLKVIKNRLLDKPAAEKRLRTMQALYEWISNNPELKLSDIREALELRRPNHGGSNRLPLEIELDLAISKINAQVQRVDLEGKAVKGETDILTLENARKYLDAPASHLLEANGERSDNKQTVRDLILRELGKEIHTSNCRLQTINDSTVSDSVVTGVKTTAYSSLLYKAYKIARPTQGVAEATNIGVNLATKVGSKWAWLTLGAKGLSRFIPVLGWGLLAVDIGVAIYNHNTGKEDNWLGASVKYACSGAKYVGKHILA